MNPEKWKSVVIPIHAYKDLKRLAAQEHRTISGQFTYILEQAKRSVKGQRESKKGA